MSRFVGLYLLVLIFAGALTALATETTFAPIGVRDPNHSAANLAVSRVSPELTTISLVSPVVETLNQTVDYQSYQSFGIAGEPLNSAEGTPSVPTVTRFYRIPNTGGADLVISDAEYDVVDNINPLPAQPERQSFRGLTRDDALYSRDEWYPANVAVMSDPMIMRDFRVVTVTLYPVQVNPVTHQARIYRHLSVDVVANDHPGTNELTNPRRPSGEWAPIYRAVIPNLDDNALDDVTTTPGTYMIVTNSNAAVKPFADSLAEWKTRKGYKVVESAQASWTSDQVYNAIHAVYVNSDPPLEYVCLMGDPGASWGIPVDGQWGFDHRYANMTAGDNIEDIGVGRLSGGTQATMATINSKIMFYERNPHMQTAGVADTMWYHKAFLYAGTNLSVSSNWLIMRWAKDQFIRQTGVYQDTIATYPGYGVDANLVQSQINNGIGYFLWRGTWVGDMASNIADVTNPGGRLPVTMEITCMAGEYVSSGINSPAEDFLCAGTATNPAGGVCGMGTSTDGTENGANGILASGMIYAIADVQVEHLGTAVASAKAQLYSTYGPNLIDTSPYTPSGQPIAQNFTHWFNLLGDPGLALWTDVPESLSVSYPTSLNIGARSVTIAVTRHADGVPVQNAVVCLWKKSPDSTWVRGTTDAQGQVTLPVNVNTSGGMYLTITKRNCLPFLYTIPCSQSAVMPMVSTWTLDDDNIGGTQGNGDHIMNPGETIDLPVYIRNFGSTTTASGISASLSSNDPHVTVVTSSASYSDIAPGDSATGSIPFRIQVSTGMQHRETVLLTTTITSSAGQTVGVIPLTCSAGAVLYMGQHLGSVFSPGGTVNVQVVLKNTGAVAMNGVSGHLSSLSPYVSVPNPDASFGNMAVGVLDSNITNFSLASLSTTFRGHQAPMMLVLTATGGFSDTVQFIVSVGAAQTTDPTGPDVYGYFAYDNSDASYPLHPTYSYVDISSSGGTLLTAPSSDPGEKTSYTANYSAVRRLPFQFKFYGRLYDSLTICSNGWCAFGNQSYLDLFRHYQIPAMGAPDAMLAPFFADMKTTGTGRGVWAMDDATNHRVIVQWKAYAWAVACIGEEGGSGGANFTTPVDFEVLLYDTTYAPTGDGNGKVVFQYNTTVMGFDAEYCDEPAGCTIGIQKPGNLVGLQYAYQSTYSPGAATIQSGRAILFTTDTGTNIVMPLNLTAPNGGELWYQHTPSLVTWTGGHSQDHIRIDLSRSGNTGPWESVTASTTNSGSFSFNPSGPPSTTCFIRVSSVETPTDADSSNSAFTVASLHVSTPNGGEVWSVDSTETIAWQGGNASSGVLIELSRNGINGPWEALNSSAPNTGGYTFTLTGTTSAHCRVRVTSLSDATDTDMSDADFTIETIQAIFTENFETGAAGWTHGTVGAWHDDWNLSTTRAHGGTTSYKCGSTGAGNYDNNCDSRLVSPVIANLPANATLQFYHWMSSERSSAHPDSAYDGGILEVSANGGAFNEVTPTGGYSATFRWWRDSAGDTATGPMRGLPCWADSMTAWAQVQLDLSAYTSQSIQLRWRFGSDSATAREGWYVDDVVITAPVISPPPSIPASLTCAASLSGNDIVLRWAADGNLAYRIYSSTSASGPFSTLEGSSNTDSFTIINGASDNRKFYIVVGWDGQ